MSNAPIIRATGIRHVFGEGSNALVALKNVDISVNQGEVLFIVGPSGSGKTTLLHILGCLLRPTAGAVFFENSSVLALDDEQACSLRLKNFGFVFQNDTLCSSLTAVENVMLVHSLLDMRGDLAMSSARQLLGEVGLAHRADAFPHEMSGGERQRVVIARAMAAKPTVLFADEPTASLDGANGLKVVEYFCRLAHEQGRAVIIVTHDQRIMHFADKIVRLEDGRAIADHSAIPGNESGEYAHGG